MPVCLLLQEIQLGDTSPDGLEWLTSPSVNQVIGWQCGQLAGDFVPYGCYGSGNCATAVRNRTWGAIKTLWR